MQSTKKCDIMKVLKLAGLALFLILVSIEVYWCFSRHGNLILYFQNQSNTDEVIEVKISLDRDVIFNGKLTSGEIIPHSLNLFKSLGQHDLWIWRGDTHEVIHA